MKYDKAITHTLEEYIEIIYTISVKKSHVRITDIAYALNISKPSANRAVNTLKEYGLVSHEPYGAIMLTDEGFTLGSRFYERHIMIKKFLTTVLELNSDDAERETRLIEHGISGTTVEKMKHFMAC